MALTLPELPAARVLPEDIAIAASVIKRAADHEEQIGEAIQILTGMVGNGFVVTQMYDGALGATADGA